MSQHPEVSIIIPTYNRAGFIRKAVNSVLRQNDSMVEIVVIDDGSTDGTESVLRDYIEKGLVTYLKQENKGVSAARNYGIKSSKGEYICFLDADDTLNSNSIKDRLDVFRKYPGLGLVFTDFKKVIRKNGKDVTYREGDLLEIDFINSIPADHIKFIDSDIYLLNKEIFRELVLRCFIWTGTVMIRRNVLNDVGYFCEELKISEDHDLWLRICLKYEIGFRALVTATYIMHDGSITKNIPLYCDSAISVCTRYLDPVYGLPNEYRKRLVKLMASYYFTKGYNYYGLDNYPEAAQCFRQALNNDRSLLRYYQYVAITYLPDSAIARIRKFKHFVSLLLRRMKDKAFIGSHCSI